MSRVQSKLFDESIFITKNAFKRSELIPCSNFLLIFEECHNYIYANSGLLKDAIFREVAKLIEVKMYDEKTSIGGYCRFVVTADEYREISSGKINKKFKTRMMGLHDDVKKSSSYPVWNTPFSLTWNTIAYVVQKLQKFDLSKTPADIAGYAFQTFVHRHQRGGRGEYFTPHPIVRLAVQMIQPSICEKIIDPACGSGGFLIEAMRYMKQKEKIKEGDHMNVAGMLGIEFNPDVALSAKVSLEMAGGEGVDVKCANAFHCDEFDGKYDIVLTNPPFGNKGRIEDATILSKFVLGKKENKNSYGCKGFLPQAPEILFIEKSMNLLRPGGRMAIILPDGILHNVSSSSIRSWIKKVSDVKSVVSLPQETFVPFGTGIKTSLVLLQKKAKKNKNKYIFFCRMDKLGYDVKGQPVYKRDNKGKILYDRAGKKIIDDDLDEVQNTYRKNKYNAKNKKMWWVSVDDVNDRWDADHYDPRDLAVIRNSGNMSRLGDLVQIMRKKDISNIPSGDIIRYIAISNVDCRLSHIMSSQIMALHELPSRASYLLREGDIITAVSGASTGTESHATALVTRAESGAVCSNGFAVFRGINLVNPLYLFSYIRTTHFLRQVRRLRTGAAIPSISLDDLAEILVPIPSLDVQDKIGKQMEMMMNMKHKILEINSLVAQNMGKILK